MQAVTDAISGHTDEIAAGIPALLEYNILEAGLEGTKQDLTLLLQPEAGDGPLVYDGDIKDFSAQYDALGLPYAPCYSLLQTMYNHTVDQAFSAFIRDILDDTEDGRFHLHVEADGIEALWALTEETAYEKVTWRETETGSMLVNNETCQATNAFSLRFLPTQLQFSLRELWNAGGIFLNLAVLVDAGAKDEITASVQMSFDTENEESLMQRDYALRLTRSEEGQRLIIQTAFQAGYHTDDFDYEASVPIEIAAEIPNDGSRIPVTLYFEDVEGISHAVGDVILNVTDAMEALAAPDFDALTMLNGLQDTRLTDDFRANGVSWLNLAIMTRLPADAHPLMFELLALVVQLARAN